MVTLVGYQPKYTSLQFLKGSLLLNNFTWLIDSRRTFPSFPLAITFRNSVQHLLKTFGWNIGKLLETFLDAVLPWREWDDDCYSNGHRSVFHHGVPTIAASLSCLPACYAHQRTKWAIKKSSMPSFNLASNKTRNRKNDYSCFPCAPW